MFLFILYFQERVDVGGDESRRQISRLEEQLTAITADRDEYQKYIRELEQSNDDLERAKRCVDFIILNYYFNWFCRNVSAMLDDLEAKLNATLEQNVLLQSEVEDKDNLNVCFGFD